MGEAATNPIMSITATPPEAFILKLPDETLARILEFVYEACYEDAVASKYGIPFYYINPVEHYSVASANARFAPLTIVCRRLHPAATSRLYANLSVTNGHLCYRTDGYCDQLRHCQRAVLSSILLRRTLSGSKSLRDLCQVLFLCDMRQSCQTGNSHTVQRKNVTDGTIRTESAVSLVRDSIVHHVEGLPGPSVLDTMIDDFAVWLKRVKSVRLCVHDISEEKEKTGHLLELMLPSMQNLQCLSIRTLEDGWARGANLPQLFRSLQSTDWMTRLRKLEIQDTYDSRCMAHRSEMWASFRKV